MKLIRGLKNLQLPNSVATIGNFDGLHLGHQKILSKVIEKAKQLNLPSVLITFEPLPQEYFLKDKAAGRLSRLRDKLIFLKNVGIDYVVCLPFNARLAQVAATDFVQHVLVERLGVKWLMVGDDFRFGRGREGDFNLLQVLGQQFGFTVEDTPTVLFDNQRIGSSRIRTALAEGDLVLATQLLGRHYAMSGRVIYGNQLGRELGVPTANFSLYGKKPALVGIFVVQVLGLGKQALSGVASLGMRPTVNGKEYLLEVHLFDFDQVIYGCYLQIEFLHKLRDEEKFDSLEALKEQMQKDIEEGRNFLRIN